MRALPHRSVRSWSRRLVLPGLCLALALSAVGRAAATVAVLSPDVAGEALDADRVRDLLLGRSTTWSDGRAVVVVILDDPAAENDLIAVLGRGHDRLIRGWKRLVFSGSGGTPLIMALDTIGQQHGAIILLPDAPDSPRWHRVVLSLPTR